MIQKRFSGEFSPGAAAALLGVLAFGPALADHVERLADVLKHVIGIHVDARDGKTVLDSKVPATVTSHHARATPLRLHGMLTGGTHRARSYWRS